MKKRRFDLRRGLRRELDLGVNAVLKIGEGGISITDAEMLQADQENAPDNAPANPQGQAMSLNLIIIQSYYQILNGL